MANILNSFSVKGNINDNEIILNSNTISVNLINGLSLTKSVDKNIWENGVLTYTVNIKNDGNSPNNITFKDIINERYVTLLPNSVYINNEKVNYTYDKSSGLLQIENIPISKNIIVTYSIIKKVNDYFVLNNVATANNISSNNVKVTSILIKNCNNFARR